MYMLSINMWFQKLMKQFFFGIDQVVYSAISSIYDLLISIARTSIFSQADILDMAERIYKLLAIFMIFKVTLSLITYVVNPDDFSDKSKGVSKLSVNIIISLGLLILTPYIFNLAFKLQTIILEDNTLATLIFDKNGDSGGAFLNTAGDTMAFITMSAFFTPNTAINELQNCIDLTYTETDSSGNIITKVNKECSGLKDDYSRDENKSTSMQALISEDYFSESALQNYVVGIENKNLSLMFRQEMAVATDQDNEDFIMDYKYIFSTVVGVVVVLLLISFCMDVALRSIKLGFLQLIAPIPILSYVDPKNGKDGMFKKWYELCFKTYLSLFIRLLALYFAIYIIEKVSDMKLVDVVDGSYQTHAFIYIFVIIGALMFAKDLPKILEALGIKLDGGGKFTLNPLKKFTDEAMGGKQILGMGAAGLAGGAAFGANMLSTKGNIFKRLGSGIAGAASATTRGIGSAIKGEKAGKVFTGSYSGAMKAKQDRAKRKADGVSFTDYWGAKIGSTLGMMSYTDQVKYGELDGIDRQIDRMKPELDHAKEVKRNSDMVKGAKSDFSGLVSKAPEVEKKQLFLDEVERRSLGDYMSGKYSAGHPLDEASARDQMERDKAAAKSERDAAIRDEMQKRITTGDIEFRNKIQELRVSAQNAGIDINGRPIELLDDQGNPLVDEDGNIVTVTLFDANGEFVGNAEDLWKAVGFNSALTTQARNVSAESAHTMNDITIETERLQKRKSDIITSDEYKAKKTAEEHASKK